MKNGFCKALYWSLTKKGFLNGSALFIAFIQSWEFAVNTIFEHNRNPLWTGFPQALEKLESGGGVWVGYGGKKLLKN